MNQDGDPELAATALAKWVPRLRTLSPWEPSPGHTLNRADRTPAR